MLRPVQRQAVGISTVEGDALDAYGHGATFRRRRHPGCAAAPCAKAAGVACAFDNRELISIAF
jgi:hypothetical protein